MYCTNQKWSRSFHMRQIKDIILCLLLCSPILKIVHHIESMKRIFDYLIDYWRTVDRSVLWMSCAFIAAAIYINYHFDLNKTLSGFAFTLQYTGWYIIFLIAFSFAYVLKSLLSSVNYFKERSFIILLFTAPAIFAWKLSYNVNFQFTNSVNENHYWNYVFYWPFKLSIIIIVLYVIWKLFDKDQKFYGLKTEDFDVKPYCVMLVMMIPLIAIASTQPDFLSMYPKMNNIAFLNLNENIGWYKLLYELSYGSDFIGIELFFRGFLVLAFIKYAGKEAIMPMALFYCTIHFGKPLAECISSFFGGIILGVVTYNTRSIFGGLIVHLGIAWLMELGGYFGNAGP